MRFSITHRGKRSQIAQQRRDIYKLLLLCSYRDQEKAETVALIPAQFYVEKQTTKPYGQIFSYFSEVEVEKGMVLVDSRGDGALQTVRG